MNAVELDARPANLSSFVIPPVVIDNETLRQFETELARWGREDRWLATKAADEREFPETRQCAKTVRKLFVKPKIKSLNLATQWLRMQLRACMVLRIPRVGPWITKDLFGNRPSKVETEIEVLQGDILAADGDIKDAINGLRLPVDHFLRTSIFGSTCDDDSTVETPSEVIPDHTVSELTPKCKDRQMFRDLRKAVCRFFGYRRKRKPTNADLMVWLQREIEDNPDKNTSQLRLPRTWIFGQHHQTWPEAYACTLRHNGCSTPCRKQINSFVSKLKNGDL